MMGQLCALPCQQPGQLIFYPSLQAFDRIEFRTTAVEAWVPRLPALATAGPLGAAASRKGGGRSYASRTRSPAERRDAREPLGQDNRGGGQAGLCIIFCGFETNNTPQKYLLLKVFCITLPLMTASLSLGQVVSRLHIHYLSQHTTFDILSLT